jgi:hypothetical protein
VLGLHGRIEELEIDETIGQIRISGRETSAQVELDVGRQLAVVGIEGGRVLESRADGGDIRRLVLMVEKQTVVRFTVKGDIPDVK